MEYILLMTIGQVQLFSNGVHLKARRIGRHSLFDHPFDISKYHAKYNVQDTPFNRELWVEQEQHQMLLMWLLLLVKRQQS